MAIYIKGMEMPKSCEECRMAEVPCEGFCHAANKWFDDEWFVWYGYEEGDIDTSKPLNCPLIEVKEPHGRLIDADVLLEESKKDGAFNYVDSWQIADASTVIERSK